MNGKFLYFAYGSNLLAKRIHVNNPTAMRYGIGKLEDYRLDFSFPKSNSWGGAPATIVHEQGSHVWGAIWEISDSDQENLDNQEGVRDNWYTPITVSVDTANGMRTCRSYHLVNIPSKIRSGEARPIDRLPSKVYKNVIINGAKESGLPEDYILKLENISTNGFEGSSECPVIL